MENQNERFREEFFEVANSLEDLTPGSEEHKRAVDELTKMYQLLIEHSKIDEEIMDRRQKMETDREDRLKQIKDEIELEYAKMKHDKLVKFAGFGTVTGTTIAGFLLENKGFIKPKLPDVMKIIKF